MAKANKNTDIQEQQEPLYRASDYIERDLDLLLLLILLEIAKSGRDHFYLSELFKGDYWDNEDFVSELWDTGDYDGMVDAVLGQAILMMGDLRIAKIDSVGIDDLKLAFDDLAVAINKADGKDPHFADSYGYIISLYAEAFVIAKAERDREIEKDPTAFFKRASTEIIKMPIMCDPDRFTKDLRGLVLETPQRIITFLKFEKGRVNDIEKEISRHIRFFSNDDAEEAFPYAGRKEYFTKQIENFHGYLTKLQRINNVIHIPFDILKERGFSAVRILRHLQEKGVASLKWTDKDYWRVSFADKDITVELLMGSIDRKTVAAPTNKILKTVLDFNYERAELTVNGERVPIQGPDQKELLRIIFANKEGWSAQWFFSQVAEEYDHADYFKTKKFYNAAYQINGRIAARTDVKKFFITTMQTVQVNPDINPARA